MSKNPSAVALGSMRSPKKAESSRRNGQLGGYQKHKRYCEMCDEWVQATECPACGADTSKPNSGKD
jgi:hypothetical protein